MSVDGVDLDITCHDVPFVDVDLTSRGAREGFSGKGQE